MSEDDTIEAARRAVMTVRAGRPEPVACVQCGGTILVASKDDAWFTTCPCKKSAGKFTFAPSENG